MSTKTKQDKTKNTQRVEGEWIADVKAWVHKDDGHVERKVLTNGIVSVPIDNIMPAIVGAMLQGQEVRLTHDGGDVIRLFPCLDRSLTKIKAAAQAMGAFAQSLTSIKFHVAGTKGKSGSDVKLESSEVKAELKRYAHVTPDTMVKCPKCGTEFRVGKQLV